MCAECSSREHEGLACLGYALPVHVPAAAGLDLEHCSPLSARPCQACHLRGRLVAWGLTGGIAGDRMFWQTHKSLVLKSWR